MQPPLDTLRREERGAISHTNYEVRGNYLFHLNSHEAEEKRLLKTTPVASYLDALTDVGIGSSGILHRILAHKAAVNYMRLRVSFTFDVV